MVILQKKCNYFYSNGEGHYFVEITSPLYTICIHVYNIHLQYATICTCDMHMQYAHAVCTCNMHMQYAHAICTCNIHMQYAYTICTHNMQMKYAYAIYIRNMHTEYASHKNNGYSANDIKNLLGMMGIPTLSQNYQMVLVGHEPTRIPPLKQRGYSHRS